ELDTLQAVVSRRVIDERQAQAAPDGNQERLENLRHHMLRRDEIDVVAADVLKIEHDVRELRCGDFCAFAKLAGLEVLTKHAAQITPAEKDRARPVPAAQTIFLAEMRNCASHARKPPTLAHSDLVVEPVNVAVTRANAA